jgi:hypothetical protein
MNACRPAEPDVVAAVALMALNSGVSGFGWALLACRERPGVVSLAVALLAFAAFGAAAPVGVGRLGMCRAVAG